MFGKRHAYTRKIIALLLTSVMILVHVVKVLHTHSSSTLSHHSRTSIIAVAKNSHDACSICEFQLAKDAPYSGEILLVIAPVHVSCTYCRLISSVNPDRLFIVDGRGPPQA